MRQPSAVVPAPDPCAIGAAAIPRALAAGWRTWRATRRVSLIYGGVFAVGGSALLWGAQLLRLAPLSVALAGGFLLLGPALMAGLIGIREASLAGHTPAWHHVLRAWREAPRGLWAMALFCVLALFIWLTDAGTLYSFMVGERVGGLAAVLPSSRTLLRFHVSTAVLGGGLAAIVFTVSVHAVPLLLGGRHGLANAVVASVRGVFRSPVAHLLWALLLAAATFVSVLLPPLLVLTLPVLAYAGHALHHEVFPPARG